MRIALKRSLWCLFVFWLAVGTTAWAQGQQGDGIWLRNAYYGEFQTFDKCFGHQPGNGQYHHHIHPICLRAQLDDNLVKVNSGRTGVNYREKTAPWKHSPILGWSFDGYPIYGPYGYGEPLNPNSTVRRLKPGFRLRSINQRTTLPNWALAHHPGVSASLAANQAGPEISDTFPLGRYIEDFEFVEGLGDLDQYNGRFAVTPEFPNGTYAYFVTINEDGSPAFPYVIGLQYYGNVTGSNNAAAPAAAQSFFANGAYAQTANSVPQLSSWYTKNSQQEARAVSGFDPSAGAKTTWPVDVPAGGRTSGSVTTPTKADTQSISYTDAAVYITANNLSSYAMGPWFIDGANGGVFPNFPSAQNNRAMIPRVPSAATTKRNTGLGAIGLWVNGVAVFNVLDGSSYSNSARNDIGGGGVRLSSMHVSAASFEGGPTSPGALVAAFPLFGAKLATGTAAADSLNWPFVLAGTTVSIRDAAGMTHSAPISYASPGQVNYRVPESVAPGLATVTLTAGGVSIPGALNVVTSYPNLFQFNGDGLAAGYVVRVRSNGQQLIEAIFQVAGGALTPTAIEVGSTTEQVYLVLFGSGLGNASANPTVSAQIGGSNATVAYAGPQGVFSGLDQYNLLLPSALAGKGKVDIAITSNGKVANLVNVTIK
ncbi:MAG: YHYH protein [Acidobacteria bacterium]|nr:YHYH protein [Acidobacteriota bacterium]